MRFLIYIFICKHTLVKRIYTSGVIEIIKVTNSKCDLHAHPKSLVFIPFDVTHDLACPAYLPSGPYILPMFLLYFSPLGKSADRAIYFTFRSFFLFIFLLWKSYLSIYWTDFQYFKYVREFSWSGPVCPILQGGCHGNQFCVVADSFARSQNISGSAGPIFTIFAPHCRYWIADDQSHPLFPISWGTLPWQNYLPPCTYRSAIPKRNGISQPQYAR